MNCRRGSGLSAPSVQRRRGARRHALIAEPCLGDQRGPFRSRDEQRFGSLVDGDAGYLGYGQLAAEPRRPLEHGHPHCLIPEEKRRSQPGDPAAHDHHMRPRVGTLHDFSLADAAR